MVGWDSAVACLYFFGVSGVRCGGVVVFRGYAGVAVSGFMVQGV